MTHPLRVLQICPGFAIEGRSGGIGQYVLSLSRALNREQIEPVLVGLWDYGTELERARVDTLRAEGFTVFTAAPWNARLGFLNVYTAFRGLQAALRKQPVDIIHSHAEFSDLAALALKQVSGTPIVMRTLHSHEWGRRPLLRIWARLLYPLSFDCEIGISADVQASLDARWLARLGKRHARQINNAIPLSRFYQTEPVDVAALKTSLGLSAESLVVGSIGRLVTQKGYDYLLRAFVAVHKTIPQAHLVLVGSGEQELEFKALAEQLGLGSIVIFAGMRPDVPTLLRSFDLFVLASHWEGLPTVILEAMAAGVPVLGSNVSGTRDLIQSGYNGWLVSAHDVSALQEAIIYALRHPVEGQKLAERARETVKTFNIETVAAQYEELYMTLVGV